MSKWPLITATVSGVDLSPAFTWLTSAPPSTSALTTSVWPWRTANCSGEKPPEVPTSSL